MNKDAVLKTLNRILELELAGVVYYTHYALMVYGYNRIPIVDWLQKQADEGLVHARLAGELVTWLGGHRRWVSNRCWKRAPMTSATFCASRWRMKSRH